MAIKHLNWIRKSYLVLCNFFHHHVPRDISGVWTLSPLMKFTYMNPQQPHTKGLLKCAVYGLKYYGWATRENYTIVILPRTRRLWGHVAWAISLWNRTQRITDIDPDPSYDSSSTTLICWHGGRSLRSPPCQKSRTDTTENRSHE